MLSLSKKNFPALHSALHGSSRAPRDRGADSEPEASQRLKPSPAFQQLSSHQVPSPALHRCSTGADQSLAAAPATPSLPTGQNFIFFKKINFVRMHNMGRKIGKNSKKFRAAQKISSYGSKTFQNLIWQGPFSSEKPYSAGMSKI